jgi:putative autoinducer-2 (AI-2) aldolase
MDWGLANRLHRILKPATGRTVMLAVDHGYFLAPPPGSRTPGARWPPSSLRRTR